jgi:nucleoside-diphosphate-sugar epimerase
MNNITILLTGASGFFGKEIYKRLKKKYKILTPNSKKLNLLNKKSISQYLKKKKIDIIINSAWIINSTVEINRIRSDNYFKNIKMGYNLTTLSKKFLIKNFLNISSINVYKSQKKKLSEKNLLKSKSYQTNEPEGLAKLFLIKKFKKIINKETQYKNLIFSNIYGFNKKKKNLLLIDKLFHNYYLKNKYKIIIYKKNKIKIDLIYINDAVSAVEFFLKKLIEKKLNDDFINIGSGRGYKINDIIKKVKGIKKTNINYVILKKNKIKNLIPSISLAKKYGWKPQYELITGLKKTENNYKKLIK